MKPLLANIFLLLMVATAGCAKKAVTATADPPAAVVGQSAQPGALLAYAHEITFKVAPDSMTRRISAVQEACNKAQFGTCSVLEIEANAGDYPAANIVVRAEPAAIEPLIALAGDGAAIASRKTTAEDLADAVADVASQRDLMQRQREVLLGYIARKDIAVADMIVVSQQLANIDTSLQSLTQQAADQRRRIETNRLSIAIKSNVAFDDRDDLSFTKAWHTFVDSLAEGTQDTAEYAGYLLPLLVLVFPLALAWRWAWRWLTRRSRQTA